MNRRVWSAQEPSTALRIQNPSLLSGPQDLAYSAPLPICHLTALSHPETPLPQSLPSLTGSLTSFEFCFLLTEALPNKFVFWIRILLCLVWTQLSLNSHISACLCLQSEVCATTPGYKVTALGDGVKLGGRALAWGAHTGHRGQQGSNSSPTGPSQLLPGGSTVCSLLTHLTSYCPLLDWNSHTEVPAPPDMDAALPASPRLSLDPPHILV